MITRNRISLSVTCALAVVVLALAAQVQAAETSQQHKPRQAKPVTAKTSDNVLVNNENISTVQSQKPATPGLVNNENIPDVRGGKEHETPPNDPTSSSSRKKKKVDGPYAVVPDGYGAWAITYDGATLPLPQITSQTEAEDTANDFNKAHNKGVKKDKNKFMDTNTPCSTTNPC
jgi:cell division septation protein DedD